MNELPEMENSAAVADADSISGAEDRLNIAKSAASKCLSDMARAGALER